MNIHARLYAGLQIKQLRTFPAHHTLKETRDHSIKMEGTREESISYKLPEKDIPEKERIA